MTREELINRYEDRDVIDIYTNHKGGRYVIMRGYYYHSGLDEEKPWRNLELCWCETELDKFVEMWGTDELTNFHAEFKQYIGDCDEDEIYELAKWISDNCEEIGTVTTETPDGTYVI